MQNITLEQAEAVNEIISHGLCSGIGKPKAGKLCVMAAINLALGAEHSDQVDCVASAARSFGISLNDKIWSTPAARAEGMKCYAIACLGSRDVIDENAFAAKLAELTIRRIVPIALREAAKLNPKHAEALDSAAVKCEADGTIDSVREARRIAAYAAYDAAAAAAYDAADAAYAADAAAAAAYDAAAAAAADAAAYAAAAAAARDRILSIAAQCGVDALRFVKSPGVQLMDKVCK